MDVVIKIIGIFFILVGILYLFKPEVAKSLMGFFKKGIRMYFAALIRFALGVVFLLAARECRQFWVIFVFGIVFSLSGLLIFLLGVRRLKSILEWWQKQSALLIRIIAVIIIAIGGVIIYSA